MAVQPLHFHFYSAVPARHALAVSKKDNKKNAVTNVYFHFMVVTFI